MTNLSLVALQKTSKVGKTYYGIFAIANDVEVLVCFISKHQYELLLKTIEVLNPMKLLSSGYSIVKSNGKVIKNSRDVNLDDVVDIELSEGKLKCSVIGKDELND